tara:strand:+ start:125 stop:238 length:114 start_codon:yes stop_codon:yes gene_type:complete
MHKIRKTKLAQVTIDKYKCKSIKKLDKKYYSTSDGKL